MTDRPIIFSAPMVRALLEGRKTQTRRVIRPDENGWWPSYGQAGQKVGEVAGHGLPGLGQTRFRVGDRLWVRETWRSRSMRPDDVIYRADGESLMSWRSPIHMPRWASRLTLTVTDVRVHRVQEIGEDHAKAEGARPAFTRTSCPDFPVFSHPSYVWGFEELWNSIHGPDAWEANPWVAAVRFTVHDGNIDKVPACS